MNDTDKGDGTIALPYDELGRRLGTSPEAARIRARRQGWRRLTGNDGRALVVLPLDAIPETAPDKTPGQRPDSPQAELDRIQAAHQAEMRRTHEAHQAELERVQVAHRAELQRQAEALGAVAAAHRAEAERLGKLVDKLTEPWTARVMRLFRSDG